MYLLLRSEKWMDIVVSANLKTASGGRLCDARYTDAASYWFDANLGRTLWKRKDVNASIRVQALISDSEQTDKHKQGHKKANTVFLLHKSPTPFFIQYWLFVPVLFSSLDFVNPDIQCHHRRPGLSPVGKS